MSSLPVESLPKHQQVFLEEVRVKMQTLFNARNELLDFINKRTDYDRGDVSDLPGAIENSDLGIYRWECAEETREIKIEDFWYASDRDC